MKQRVICRFVSNKLSFIDFIKMLYSNFYNKWIATCMRCNLALINFDTSVNSEKFLRELFNKKYYNYQI